MRALKDKERQNEIEQDEASRFTVNRGLPISRLTPMWFYQHDHLLSQL